MTILAYTGVPGSGKSAHAARDVRYALDHPRLTKPVIANFRLSPTAPVKHPELFTYIPNEQMTAGKIVDVCDMFWDSSGLPFREDYITLVLDECAILFNARLWGQKSRMSYLELMSQSRKVGLKVILISQSLMMIDNQFRMMVEVEHNHRRISAMGGVGWLASRIFGGNVFLDVRYLSQGHERLGADLFVPSKSDFAMYDSYARFAQAKE